MSRQACDHSLFTSLHPPCLRLIDAFDTIDTSDFADTGEDGFELAAIDDFEVDVNLRVQAVGAAFEIVDVTAGVADHRGDLGQQPGAVFRANDQVHQKLGSACATPFNGEAALGLIQEVLHVGTCARVHRDAAPARDVTDNVVAGNRVAAFGAIDQ